MHKIMNWKQHKKMDCLYYRFNSLLGSLFVTGTYKPPENITLWNGPEPPNEKKPNPTTKKPQKQEKKSQQKNPKTNLEKMF